MTQLYSGITERCVEHVTRDLVPGPSAQNAEVRHFAQVVCVQSIRFRRAGRYGRAMSSETSSKPLLVVAIAVAIAFLEAYVWMSGQSGW